MELVEFFLSLKVFSETCYNLGLFENKFVIRKILLIQGMLKILKQNLLYFLAKKISIKYTIFEFKPLEMFPKM